jgi:hypothetical protein
MVISRVNDNTGLIVYALNRRTAVLLFGAYFEHGSVVGEVARGLGGVSWFLRELEGHRRLARNTDLCVHLAAMTKWYCKKFYSCVV